MSTPSFRPRVGLSKADAIAENQASGQARWKFVFCGPEDVADDPSDVSPGTINVSVIAPAAYLGDFVGQSPATLHHVRAQRILHDQAYREFFLKEQQRDATRPAGRARCGRGRSQPTPAASAVMSAARSGRSTTYWPARRRKVTGWSKAVLSAASTAMRSSRLNAATPAIPALTQDDVVAP
jgi:hypothetical protein